MGDSKRDQIAALMREAGKAHHRAHASTGGENPEWARWYADHLAQPLGAALGRTFSAERLAQDLAAVDAEHRARAPEADWPDYYAEWFLDRYSGE
jgi:hypothetical protein